RILTDAGATHRTPLAHAHPMAGAGAIRHQVGQAAPCASLDQLEHGAPERGFAYGPERLSHRRTLYGGGPAVQRKRQPRDPVRAGPPGDGDPRQGGNILRDGAREPRQGLTKGRAELLGGPLLPPAEPGGNPAVRPPAAVGIADRLEVGTIGGGEDLGAGGGPSAAGGVEEGVDRESLPGEDLARGPLHGPACE